MQMYVGEELLNRLAEAVTVTVAPASSNDQRKQAYMFLEDFKTNASTAQKIGIAELFMRNERLLWNSSVTHFALQIVEEVVKSNWSTLSLEQKISVKTFATALTSLAVGKIDVADGIAKVLVEVIKRESAKEWPQIMLELETLSEKGPSELHVISILFLRLTEDTFQFKEGPSNVLRERLESFLDAISQFIPFLIRSLNRSSHPDLLHVARNFIKICSTIAEFAPVKHLWEFDGKLIDVILFQMMEFEPLRLDIAEFLYNILERRHPKMEVLNLLMQFLSKPAYFNVLAGAVQRPGAFSVETYKVFKRFSEVFVGLSYQLSLLDGVPDWALVKSGEESPFQKYLRILFELISHPSPVISSTAVIGWSHLMGHKIFSQLPDLKLFVHPLLRTCLNLFLLHELDHNNQYLEMDFMHQPIEFREFLISHRARVTELLRKIRKFYAQGTLDFALSSLKYLLDESEMKYQPWSALLYVIPNCVPCKQPVDGVGNARPNLIRTYRVQVFQLLDRLVGLEGFDKSNLNPGILSVRLSCISKLALNFIPPVENDEDSSDLRQRMLKKIYTFNLQLMKDSAGSRDGPTDELHLHTKNLVTSLCRNMSAQLVECYDEVVRMTIECLNTGSDVFTVTDRCALLEGLIILTKSVEDVAKKGIINEILAAVSPFWQSADFSACLKSGSEFVSFFGLGQPLKETFDIPVLTERRQQLFFCSSIFSATVMNIKFSDASLMVLLENAFGLLGSLLNLYEAKTRASLAKSSQCVLELPDGERRAILKPLFGDLGQQVGVSDEVIRMQNWMQGNFENVCRIIGFAGRCFSNVFYDVPNLTSVMSSSVIQKLKSSSIPIFRVRTVIRELLAHFIRNCPEDRYEVDIVPVLTEFCPIIARLLMHLWNNFAEEKSEQEEILQDALRQGFTKDYGNLILQRIFCDPLKQPAETNDEDVEMMEDFQEDALKQSPKSSDNTDEISKLGLICLQTPKLSESLLLTIFDALSWRDSQLSLRFTQLAQVVLTPLFKPDQSPLNREGASYIMQAVLNGLKAHGHLESNQSILLNLGVAAYSNLKPRYPDEVTRAFLCTDGGDPLRNASFEPLDKVVFPKSGGKVPSDKVKREAFKKIFELSIRPLGESLKHQVTATHTSRRTDKEKITPKSSYLLDDNVNLPLFFGAA